MNDTLVIIQARMTSTRLPGKVLLPVLGRPLLSYMVERVLSTSVRNGIVIATTQNISDDPICQAATELGVSFFRGSEDDVLSRYYECARSLGAQRVVRLTADCPLIDPTLLERCLNESKNLPENFFITTSPSAQSSRTYPRGMDIEVFSFKSLEKAFYEARTPEEREHVTVFMRRRLESYPLHLINSPVDLGNLRLTVDEMEDFQVVSRIIEALYPLDHLFGLDKIAQFLQEHKEIRDMNINVRHKLL